VCVIGIVVGLSMLFQFENCNCKTGAYSSILHLGRDVYIYTIFF